MPLQDDYQVRLSNFEGPLDLLLFLIRRAEVDIQDIPIVSITGQYFDFLKQIDEIDIELAGEFLVMAATLIEIKSRSIRPIEPRSADDAPDDLADGLEAADPRYELVQQLIAYQRYRMASERLDEHRFEFNHRFPATAGVSDTELAEGDSVEDEHEAIDIDDAHLGDLIAAYQRIVEAVDFGRIGDHDVEYDDTPIALHAQDLIDRMDREPSRRLTLQDVFTGRRRVEMIGLFLAVLELARNQRVRVIQESDKDPIGLELLDESERESVADEAVVPNVAADIAEESTDIESETSA